MGPMRTLWDVTSAVAKALSSQEPSISDPFSAAKRWVQEIMGLTPLEWACSLREACPSEPLVWKALKEHFETHKPLSRMQGSRFFWKHSFFINPWTLDPRPESEGFIQLVLNQPILPQRIVDLGTGSGCLLISLLHEIPNAMGLGIDVEPRVFPAAQKNAETVGVTQRCAWLCSSWCVELPKTLHGTFDCIVSNPPYVAPHEALPQNVLIWDPPLALFAGQDGLASYRALIPEMVPFLAPHGIVILEIGAMQGEAVSALLRAEAFSSIQILQDLQGRNRYVMAHR